MQGVFFRASCAEQARRLGLSGWVRNRDDGAVEAVFEGPDDAVEAIERWCRSGPPLAHVEHVIVSPEPPEGTHGFRVVG